MKKLIIFHSGNPAWLSCKKAIGVANSMLEKFSDTLELEIHTTDSEAAKGYIFKNSTTILLNNEQVPLLTALNSSAMEDYLQEHM